MALYVAACQYRQGTIIGGPTGNALLAAAEDWATSQGVVDLGRVCDVFAPGDWGPAQFATFVQRSPRSGQL
jgi:hypothetical protein